VRDTNRPGAFPGGLLCLVVYPLLFLYGGLYGGIRSAKLFGPRSISGRGSWLSRIAVSKTSLSRRARSSALRHAEYFDDQLQAARQLELRSRGHWDRHNRTGGGGGSGGRTGRSRHQGPGFARFRSAVQGRPGVITPDQPRGPSVGGFHQIAYKFIRKWAGTLRNLSGHGGRSAPQWPPEFAALRETSEMSCSSRA
jgi:hypothetical protein